jgi:hypothetical protein
MRSGRSPCDPSATPHRFIKNFELHHYRHHHGGKARCHNGSGSSPSARRPLARCLPEASWFLAPSRCSATLGEYSFEVQGGEIMKKIFVALAVAAVKTTVASVSQAAPIAPLPSSVSADHGNLTRVQYWWHHRHWAHCGWWHHHHWHCW